MSDDVNVTFGGTIEGLRAAATEAKEEIEGFAESMKATQAAFAEFGEVLAAAFAVEKIADFVKEMSELGATVNHATQQLGLSAEAVSQFQFAAGAMGVSSQGATLALERLERNMAQAREGTGPAAAAFRSLGIEIQDSSGHLKSLDDILPEVAEKFSESKDGADKTAIAIALFGRAGAEMIPFLNQGTEGLEKFKKMGEETGSIITGPMSEGMEKTAIETYTLGKALDGVGITIYEAFKPAFDSIIKGLIDFAESCNNAMRSTSVLHDVLGGLVVSFDLMIAAIATISNTLQFLWQVIASFTERAINSLDTLGKVMVDALTGHWSKINSDLNAGTAQSQQILAERGEKMKDILKDLGKTYKDLFSNINSGGVDTSGGAEGGEEGGKKKQLNFNPNEQIGKTWDEQMEELLSDFNNEVWKEIKQITKQNSEEIGRDLEKDINHDLDQANKDLEYKLKQQQKMEEDAAKATQKSWDEASNTITRAMDGMLIGVLQGTQTWRQAMSKLFDNLVLSFIEGVAKMAVHWAIMQLEKVVVAEASDAAVTASATARQTANAAGEVASVKPGIFAHAGSAAAAVYDDVSQIPYVGWLLAPPAAAAAWAAVAAFGSGLPSAAGGWMVDSDGPAMVHENERILPARYSAGLDAMVSNAAENGGSGSGGGGNVINLHLNAIDGQSAANFLKNNQGVIASVLAGAVRNGSTSLGNALRSNN